MNSVQMSSGRFNIFSEISSGISDMVSSLTDPVKSASRKFAKHLPSFYIALADRIEHTQGSNYLDFFRKDAARYGVDETGKEIKSPRSILSTVWADRLENDGSLSQAFSGTIPAEDEALIRMAEQAGASAMPSVLRDIARMSLLTQQAKQMFVSVAFVSFVALLILLVLLILTPTLTAPLLKDLFDLPNEYVPNSAARIYTTAGFLEVMLIPIIGAIAAATYWVIWSLPNLTGDLRIKLDNYLIWKLYRNLNGALFLSTLSTMVKRRGNVSQNLLSALQTLSQDAIPWRKWHIDKMIANIEDQETVNVSDNNMAVGQALNTGMFDRELYFYFIDVLESRGLAEGLNKTAAQVEGPTLKSVQLQSRVFSTIVLFFAFVMVITWSLAHLLAARDIVAAIKLFLQS